MSPKKIAQPLDIYVLVSNVRCWSRSYTPCGKTDSVTQNREAPSALTDLSSQEQQHARVHGRTLLYSRTGRVPAKKT